MRRLFQTQRTRFQLLESALVLLFFVQALRYLIGALYSRIASASIVAAIQANNPEALDQIRTAPGFITPDVVGGEISLLAYMVALPLLAVIIGRFRFMLVLAAVLTAGGRTLLNAETDVTTAAAAALTVGGGLLYITLLIRHRLPTFAPTMTVALAADQLIRAAGNTLDLSWDVIYFPIQLGLLLAVLVLTVVNFLNHNAGRSEETQQGLLPFWGGISLGALLFLQLSLLSLANAVVGRADIQYPLAVPLLLAATLLPLLPAVRRAARSFIGTFDVAVRGWVWLLLIFLLLVLGTRFTGGISGFGFVAAQFAVSMLWWWLPRPRGERERSIGGLWVMIGALVFALLVGADVLTYEYAYAAVTLPIEILNTTLVPLLRGFRGLGYAVILFAALLATLPMLQSQRRIAWRSTANTLETVLISVLIAGTIAGGAYLATPPLITPPPPLQSLRVGTYNIHGGYTEYYATNLEEVAQTILASGADVVLLQEIEAGRLTSFGVDQPLWLARRLGMDRRFFPTNEGLQGLAVLSKVEIAFDDGEILASIGQQTGLQRVQIQPREGEVVTLYNTWLGLLIQGEDIDQQEADQQQQLDQIISIISQHHPDRQLGRTVLGGTFNNVPDSDLVRSVGERGFSDPFAGTNVQRSATLLRTGIRARVDYVWIYPQIAEGVGVMPTIASDHRLTYVQISLGAP
jgi:endonuclease/exonuclease/phosphatase family metal-dependent hydrolase